MKNIHFLLDLGKSFRNNSPPTKLSNTILLSPPMYSLQYASHVNHVSTPSTLPTLVHHPQQLRQHVTQTGTSPTLARHQCKHTTHVSTPRTQACPPRHLRQHKQQVISQTPWYPIKFLKLLSLRFQEEIQQYLFSIFIFTTFNFSAFLRIFIEVWKTAIEKLYIFRRNQSGLFKRRRFFKTQIRNYFRKNCFLILVSFQPFCYAIVY